MGQKAEEIAAGEKLIKELIAANQAQEEYNIKRKAVTYLAVLGAGESAK